MPDPNAREFQDATEMIETTPDVLPFKKKEDVVVDEGTADVQGLIKALEDATDAGDVDEEALKLDQAA